MMWSAPHAVSPVHSPVDVPGSKSATARALVLSALASGIGTIRGGLSARDTSLMVAGLRVLGAAIDDTDPLCWQVTPLTQTEEPSTIDCGLAGTVMRFLPPIAALSSVPIGFMGDEAASSRPVAPLLDALAQLGAHVESDRIPFSVCGPLTRRQATIDSSQSSQFISGILLSAPRMPNGVHLTHRGSAIPSLPHITMTMEALEQRGVHVSSVGTTWQVEPGPISPQDESIEPDLTTAAVFLAAALVTGGSVTIPRWPASSTQPGLATPDILCLFGGSWTLGSDGLTMRGDGTLNGVDVDLHQTSELTPVVAALAALSSTPSSISGVAHIRGHETDRLSALSTQINALGGDCVQTPDGLRIRPRPLHGGVFHTYGDHRMAHAGALIGVVVPGVVLDDVDCTSKTMPEFPEVWKELIG